MRFSESDQDSLLSSSSDYTSLPGPSSAAMGNPGPSSSSNGYQNNASSMNGNFGGNNGYVAATNGSSSNGIGNGIHKTHGKSVMRVNLPGTMLYEDDESFIDREEFVRLVIQSLREVGYFESAATLETESGYSMETQEVSQFKQYILHGHWPKAEAALTRLGVNDEASLLEARFLISEQKYLELLESNRTTAALYVLRNELAPLEIDSDHLHLLSSLIMCSDPQDLRQKMGWDGALGNSRQHLLNNLHRYIPSSVMIPQRRLSTIIQQARLHQRSRCVYHNLPSNSIAFSLYTDHQCNKSAFPRITTTILDGHTDEVWNIEWSHDGGYLASASKDKSVIIWRVTYTGLDPSSHDWVMHLKLKDHPYPVGCLAWSIDDSLLLTGAEHFIKIWNTKTGVCLRTLEEHSEPVTALAWLPDGSGFISGSLDRKVNQWDADGKLKESWGTTATRVTDLAITPDLTRLVTIGMHHQSSSEPSPPSRTPPGDHQMYAGGAATAAASSMTPPNRNTNNRLIVYDLASKQVIASVRMEGELTSVKISQNSQFALINHAPDEIHLWDLKAGRLARKFAGQSQDKHVIRSCFGGVDGCFIVSGNGKVYVWHRDTGALLEALPGHGEGSVNSVAWNPRHERMFASCSDDNTIRIWEPMVPESSSDDVVDGAQSSLVTADTDSLAESYEKGKGKTRQQDQAWEGTSVAVETHSSTSASRGSGADMTLFPPI
ncbi:WD40 repeat-like protein [Amanita rubescens]|nr:WD40 repeat-like protein [Amanita rubescens]